MSHASQKSRRFLSAALAMLFMLILSGRGYAQTSVGTSTDTRTAAINRILADYRDDQMKIEPEAASLAGDKRFNDKLSDFSASAVNARLSRGQAYIQRLSEIDTTGLPEKTRRDADSLLNSLIEEQSGDRAKTWQRPLEQFSRLHTHLLAIAEKLPFKSTKDYEDYIARLKKLPNALSQIMTNIQLGADSGHVLSPQDTATVEIQSGAVTSQPAEMGPFASPLKRFPASVPADDRKRLSADLLDAVSTDAIPAYQRFGRFVTAHSAQKAANPAS